MKIWTKVYMSEDGEMINSNNPAEEDLNSDELGDYVDEYRLMREFLQNKSLQTKYHEWKDSLPTKEN